MAKENKRLTTHTHTPHTSHGWLFLARRTTFGGHHSNMLTHVWCILDVGYRLCPSYENTHWPMVCVPRALRHSLPSHTEGGQSGTPKIADYTHIILFNNQVVSILFTTEIISVVRYLETTYQGDQWQFGTKCASLLWILGSKISMGGKNMLCIFFYKADISLVGAYSIQSPKH